MEKNIFDTINKYALELLGTEGNHDKLKILTKIDGDIYETRDGADFSKLQESDIIKAQDRLGTYWIEEELLRADNEINAVVLSETPYCKKARDEERTIRAALDDMAQIVGHKVQTCEYDMGEIKRALKKATGCLVKERYTISTGRSLFEAVVALDVLEKSAEVNIRADVLGGTKDINLAEAKLMRIIYKKKYSKAEQKVKAEVEQ